MYLGSFLLLSSLVHSFPTPTESFILPTKSLSYVHILCFILFVLVFSCDSPQLFRVACMSMSRGFCLFLFMEAQGNLSVATPLKKLTLPSPSNHWLTVSPQGRGGLRIPSSGMLTEIILRGWPQPLWVWEHSPRAMSRRQRLTALVPISWLLRGFFLCIWDGPWVFQRWKHSLT